MLFAALHESASGPGRVKTKSNLVVALSGGGIFAFFSLSVTTSLKIPGAVIPRRVFTQPGSFATNAGGPTNPIMSAFGLGCAETLCRKCRSVAVLVGWR